MSLKDKILNAQLKSETVFVPQWDAEVLVKELNGGQRSKYFQDMMIVDNQGNIRQNPEFMSEVELVELTACDPETGERLFKREDREFLLQASGEAIEMVAQTASILSGLSAKSVEVAEKN